MSKKLPHNKIIGVDEYKQLLRGAWTEREFTSQVVFYAQERDWEVVHFETARAASGNWVTAFIGDPGFPDIIAARRGVLLAAELKVTTKPSPAQLKWLAALALIPGAKTFVWWPKDWDTITRELE